MRFSSKTITIATKKPFDFVQIDDQVRKAIAESKIKNGFVLLRSCHTTAALVCIENDKDVLRDLEAVIRKLLPDGLGWAHTYEGTNNARAHQAVSLFGQTHWLPIENGQLKLGTWQALFLIEFFEGRSRKIEVTLAGE
jgi:secondary thiamine-phosphate synthase enzyme